MCSQLGIAPLGPASRQGLNPLWSFHTARHGGYCQPPAAVLTRFRLAVLGVRSRIDKGVRQGGSADLVWRVADVVNFAIIEHGLSLETVLHRAMPCSQMDMNAFRNSGMYQL